ncbi:MAG: YIP1 family protein [Planktotalea sp.]|uniref:YIP1 family protein n=1 Tax=Planktotalea sp. TaxID=2029877 RepID=UPI003C77D5A6
MLNALGTFALRTISEPRDVAAELLGMRIEKQTLWIALGLVVVLNTIVYQVGLIASPPNFEIPALFSSPVPFAILVGVGLVLSIYSLTYAGRILGGQAKVQGMMVLLIWLQYLRLAVQLLVLLLMPIMPGIAGILVFGASLYGMWLVLQFVDVAHGFNNLFTSFGTLVFSGLGIMLGLAIVLTLLGVQNMGLTPYV